MLSRSFTTKEQLVLILVSGAIVVGALAVYVIQVRNPQMGAVALAEQQSASEAKETQPEPSEAASAPETQAAAPAPPPLPVKVVVSIRGAVNGPGVYELRESDRIDDLVERAGGTTSEADLSDINLAAHLIDGTTLLVPEKPRPGMRQARRSTNPPEYTIHGWRARQDSVAVGGTSPGQPAGLLDLNLASLAELDALPGIGPKLAEAIIEHRKTQHFRRVEDLLEVHGIGEMRFEAIRGLVTVH